MSEERSSLMFEIDEQIARLRADLRDLTERAAAANGAASEDRLNELITSAETQLTTLQEKRDALASGA